MRRSARQAARKEKEEEERGEEIEEKEERPKREKRSMVMAKEEDYGIFFVKEEEMSEEEEERMVEDGEEVEDGEIEEEEGEEEGGEEVIGGKKEKSNKLKDKETFDCPLCQLKCIGKYGLEHHFRKDHKDDDIPAVFTCDLCDKSYKRYSCLQKHKRLTHLRKIKRKKEGAVQCPLCDAKFSGNYVLSDHLRLEHGEIDIRPFECDKCGLLNRTANALRNHKKKHLPGRGEYHCEICNMHFPKYAGLERHQKQRHGVVLDSTLALQPKDFACMLCESKFSYQSHLDNHLEKDHADVDSGSFECTECPRSFKTHRAVVAHRKTHLNTPTDERSAEKDFRFPCDLCARRFEKWEGLVFHQRQVHQTVSEQCKTLEKEIDYGVKCPICEKYYKGNHALSCHIQKEHPDFEGRLFVCIDCNADFKHYARLRQHRTSKHGIPVKFKQGYLKANPGLKKVKDAERRQKNKKPRDGLIGVEIAEGGEISEEMLMKLTGGVKEEPIDWDEVEEEDMPCTSGVDVWGSDKVKREEVDEDSLDNETYNDNSNDYSISMDETETEIPSEGTLKVVKKEEPVF